SPPISPSHPASSPNCVCTSLTPAIVLLRHLGGPVSTLAFAMLLLSLALDRCLEFVLLEPDASLHEGADQALLDHWTDLLLVHRVRACRPVGVCPHAHVGDLRERDLVLVPGGAAGAVPRAATLARPVGMRPVCGVVAMLGAAVAH